MPPKLQATSPLAHAVVAASVTRSGASGRVALGALAALLAAGVWLRFNDRIASVLPMLAAPGTAASIEPSGLVELALLPQSDALTAVSGMGLSAADAGALTEALRRGRLRLVRMPVFDAQPSASATPHLVRVSAGGYATTVPLTARPVAVTLPVGPVGTVSLSADGAAASVGALTLDGPVRFPDLQAGQMLEVGVIAQ